MLTAASRLGSPRTPRRLGASLVSRRRERRVSPGARSNSVLDVRIGPWMQIRRERSFSSQPLSRHNTSVQQLAKNFCRFCRWGTEASGGGGGGHRWLFIGYDVLLNLFNRDGALGPGRAGDTTRTWRHKKTKFSLIDTVCGGVEQLERRHHLRRRVQRNRGSDLSDDVEAGC